MSRLEVLVPERLLRQRWNAYLSNLYGNLHRARGRERGPYSRNRSYRRSTQAIRSLTFKWLSLYFFTNHVANATTNGMSGSIEFVRIEGINNASRSISIATVVSALAPH